MDDKIVERWKQLEERLSALIGNLETTRQQKVRLQGENDELQKQKDRLEQDLGDARTKTSDLEERLTRGHEILGRALERLETALTEEDEESQSKGAD